MKDLNKLILSLECFLNLALCEVLKMQQVRGNLCSLKTYNPVGDLENKIININLLILSALMRDKQGSTGARRKLLMSRGSFPKNDVSAET